ncbi:hypothetical protein F5887DRAFT_516628 [Amanita rubescens]|nr:hypothetical protein F5887DRAFT_516628 [Amanita rubescens]
MLRQVYLQMVPRTAIRIDAIPATSASPNSHSPHTTVIDTASMSSTSSNSLISVSPLYNCLSNYNKTLIVRRSSDLSVGAIDIFGTYEPQDLLPIFVKIIYKQFKENCELQAVGKLREIEDNQYELQEADDNDVDVKRDRKGDERTGHQKGGSSGGASNMSLIKQDEMWMRKPGNRLHFITYDYDIRGYGGINYIFSDDRTLLSAWTPQRRAGNSEIPPPTITPHITIVARLAAGVSGETFIAKCDGGPHLVWKEIPLDDHGQYARTEVMIALADELIGKLRAAGVEHGDWAPRNICLRHGKVRVIDFTHSYLIAPVPLMRKPSRLQKLRPEIDLT